MIAFALTRYLQVAAALALAYALSAQLAPLFAEAVRMSEGWAR